MTPVQPIGERVRAVEIRIDKAEQDIEDIEDRLEASGDRSTQLRVAIVGLLATTIAAVIGLVSALLLAGGHV